MTVTEKMIAVIPARGGSKRIPGKNLRPLAGTPLIAYTVAAACDSGLFDQVVVSTDSPEIAEIARYYGAEVPFLRDAQLSGDFTPVSEATADALCRVDPDGEKFQSVAQLMANCPLRTASDVRASYEQFRESRAESQISVVRYGWQNPWWALCRNDQYKIAPLFPEQMSMRSQDQAELFCPTGAVWWARAETLRRSRTFHLENRTGWELPWERGIDIDTFQDWTLAEVLVKVTGLGQDEFQEAHLAAAGKTE
jgi:N-acylneuraminate cytidylyltransferase